MTVAFDAFSEAAEGTGNFSWTHSPVGTPRGVLVFVRVSGTTGTTNVTGVTYGGEALSQVALSPMVHNGAGTVDDGVTYCFFLGSGLPTGDQTIVVTVDGTLDKRPGAYTITATADTEVVDTSTVNGDSVTNPSMTVSLAGRTSFVAECFLSGHNNVANITEPAGWTNDLENDFGNQTAGWYSYDTIGSTDVTAGWTQIADDAGGLAVAVSEVEGAVPRTITTSLDSLVKEQDKLVTTSLDALVKEENKTETATLDAFVSNLILLSTSLDSLVSEVGRSINTQLDAVVLGERTTTTNLDSFIQELKSITTNLDGLVVVLAQIVTASLDAIVTQGITKTANLDALILSTQTIITSLDALVSGGKTVTTNLDAILFQDVGITLELDALVRGEIAASTNLDGVLQGLATITTALDGIMRKVNNLLTLSFDAFITQEFTTATTIDAIILKELTLSVVFDAFTLKTLNSSTVLDAIVRGFSNLTPLTRDSEEVTVTGLTSEELDVTLESITRNPEGST